MSKIGLHIVPGSRTGFGAFLTRLRDANAVSPTSPLVLKMVGDFGPAGEAKGLLGADRVLAVGRVNSIRDQYGNEVNLQAFEPRDFDNATEAAKAYYSLVKPKWQQNPHIDVWETFNEFSEHWAWQGAFYIAMMDLAGPDGFKLAHYAFSSGNPPGPPTGGIDSAIIREIVPSLRETKQRGHYLSVHEYGGIENPDGTMRNAAPFHTTRYRWLRAALRVFDADPLIIVSECGTNGGHQFPGIEPFMDSLAWYDAELFKDAYVVGGAVFTLGTYAQANFQAALPALADYIITHPTPPPPPDEPPPSPASGQYELRLRLTLDTGTLTVSLTEASLEPIDEPPPPPPPPVHKTWVGLHMAARGGPFIPGDWDCLTRGKIEAAKLMSNHTFEDLDRLVTMVDPVKIVFRMFADMRDVQMNADKFYNVHRAWLARLVLKGVRHVEVHNEPNIASEGLGAHWLDAVGFANYYTVIAGKILAEFPALLVGYPGLSPQSNVAEWLPTIGTLIARGLIDWIGAHSYWQTPAQMDDPNHGRYYRRFLQFGKTVMLTEFSNNLGSVSPAVKADEYVRYYRSLRVEGALLSAFCFVSSSAPGSPDYGRNEPWVLENGSLSPIPDVVGAR